MTRIGSWLHRRDPAWLAARGDIPALGRLLDDEDVGVRRATSEALAELAAAGRPLADVAPAIVAATRETDVVVRFWAVGALGAMSSDGAVDALVARLEDENPDVALAAAVALVTHRSARGADLLIRTATNESAPADHRRDASDAVIRLGKRSAKRLISFLSDDSEFRRATAARLLRGIRWEPSNARDRAAMAIAEHAWDDAVASGDAAIAPLRLRLSDADGDVRRSAALALHRLGDPAGTHALRARYAGLEGLRCLLSEAGGSNAEIVRALGPDAVPDLLALRAEPATPLFHAEVRRALGQLGAEAVPALVAALSHSSAPIREASANALTDLGWHSADPRQAVARASAMGDFAELAGLGPPGRDAIVAGLADPDPATRKRAVDALSSIPGRIGVDSLIVALGNEDPVVRRAAASALGARGDDRAAGALIRALDDEEWFIRAAAVESLAALRAGSAFEPVVGRLDDHVVEVQRVAATALGALGNPRVVPALRRALGAADHEVRRRAAVSLGRLGRGEALTDLASALVQDPSLAEVAEAAMRSIVASTAQPSAFGPQGAIPTLVTGLSHRAKGTREASARMLDLLGWSPASFDEEVALSIAVGDWARTASLGRQAVPALLAVGHDLARTDRLGAADALATLGDEHAVRILLELLRDAWQREATAQRAYAGNKEAYDRASVLRADDMPFEELALEEAGTELAEAEGRVRAVMSVIRQHPDVAEQLIEDAAVHPSVEMRNRADWLRRALGGDRTLTALLDGLESPEVASRRAAARELRELDWEPKADAQRALLALAEGDWPTVSAIGAPAILPLVGALEASEYGFRQRASELLLDAGWQPREDRHRVLLAIARGDVTAIRELGDAAADELAAVADPPRWVGHELARIGDVRAVPLLGTQLGKDLSRAMQARRNLARARGHFVPGFGNLDDDEFEMYSEERERAEREMGESLEQVDEAIGDLVRLGPAGRDALDGAVRIEPEFEPYVELSRAAAMLSEVADRSRSSAPDVEGSLRRMAVEAEDAARSLITGRSRGTAASPAQVASELRAVLIETWGATGSRKALEDHLPPTDARAAAEAFDTVQACAARL